MARHTSGTVDHDLPSTVGWRKLMFSTPSMAVGFRWVGFRQKKQAFWGEILNSEGFLKDQNKQSIFWEVASNTSQTIIPWGKKNRQCNISITEPTKKCTWPNKNPCKIPMCVLICMNQRHIYMYTSHQTNQNNHPSLSGRVAPKKHCFWGPTFVVFFVGSPLSTHHRQMVPLLKGIWHPMQWCNK